ncbi:hypothetical protein [Azospirillum sp.]|uniref:hypothetical protein n=1 Tax=Azospirillum sp. TaxID=34012 RepID=UPI002D2C1D0B|nr:hypothetical protein [Azospirillum sp.]HYD69926.1 hypothetical protein [Azospirillum sp.]
MPHPLEYATPDELDAIHLKLLRRQLSALARRVPFCRRKWEAGARHYPRLESLADLALLPFTEKAELAAGLGDAPPLGRRIAFRRAGWRVRPVPDAGQEAVETRAEPDRRRA